MFDLLFMLESLRARGFVCGLMLCLFLLVAIGFELICCLIFLVWCVNWNFDYGVLIFGVALFLCLLFDC